MADPGFPVGGRGPEAVMFRKFLYVETKESGPLGGGGGRGRAPGTPPLDPPMVNIESLKQSFFIVHRFASCRNVTSKCCWIV